VKPLIGISARRRVIAGSLGQLPSHIVANAYVEAVTAAGGVPVILPCMDSEATLAGAASCDGLVLTGGEDVDPALHGRDPDPTVIEVDPERDRYDLALAEQARDRRQPLLAVCRGMQILNTLFGGDLLVDIPTEVGTRVVHRLARPGAVPEHPVTVEAGSRLAAILGNTRITVNSSHHQAVRQLGKGLSAVAWSDDGVVEAVEPDDDWSCWAVQWHPEHRPPDNAASRTPFLALCRAAARGSGCP
jgi:gamma-glutamyl-gamma-aminobutyrate hydrolase PuuD